MSKITPLLDFYGLVHENSLKFYTAALVQFVDTPNPNVFNVECVKSFTRLFSVIHQFDTPHNCKYACLLGNTGLFFYPGVPMIFTYTNDYVKQVSADWLTDVHTLIQVYIQQLCRECMLFLLSYRSQIHNCDMVSIHDDNRSISSSFEFGGELLYHSQLFRYQLEDECYVYPGIPLMWSTSIHCNPVTQVTKNYNVLVVRVSAAFVQLVFTRKSMNDYFTLCSSSIHKAYKDPIHSHELDSVDFIFQ